MDDLMEKFRKCFGFYPDKAYLNRVETERILGLMKRVNGMNVCGVTDYDVLNSGFYEPKRKTL